MSLFIHPHLSIPEEELQLDFQRSGGPGGQNVNKVSSAVRLRFDVLNSPTLSDAQKARLQEVLGHRLTKDGVLLILAQQERSQWANREKAYQRLQSLLQHALKRQKQRKATRVSRGKLTARKTARKQHQAKKKQRGNVNLRQLPEG